MKIFSNTSFKSFAAAAAVLLFASSAVYAACTTDCATYADAKATAFSNSIYTQAYNSCRASGAPDESCRYAAQREAQNAYNSMYSYHYGQCTNGNCV